MEDIVQVILGRGFELGGFSVDFRVGRDDCRLVRFLRRLGGGLASPVFGWAVAAVVFRRRLFLGSLAKLFGEPWGAVGLDRTVGLVCRAVGFVGDARLHQQVGGW